MFLAQLRLQFTNVESQARQRSTIDLPAQESLVQHPLRIDKGSAARLLQKLAGTALCRSGQRPAWMYYVRKGEAVMQRVTPAGAPVLLQRARGGFLAEAGLTSARYHCDGVCNTACDLLTFPLPALREAINSDAGTRWAWIALLGAQARQQRARIERQALKTIRERLRHLLTAHPTGAYEMTGTKADLAAEPGVTSAAMYRCLAVMQAEGALTIRGAQLTLH